jgi:hypothetical protein
MMVGAVPFSHRVSHRVSHRAILTPQIFRHHAEDRLQDSHQSRFTADNRIAFVPIF